MGDFETTEKAKAAWERADHLEIESVYQSLLKNPSGRKFLYYILGLGKIGHNAFTSNALTTAFTCGEQNVGQRILADILSADPDGWVIMQREANDEYRTRQQFIDGND